MKKLASELVQNMQNLTAIKSIDVAVKNTKINLGFSGQSVLDLPKNIPDKKLHSAIVIGAGPSLHIKKSIEQIIQSSYSGLIICSDGAFPHCLRNGLIPDIVVTLDPHPTRIVRWFGDTNLNEKNNLKDDYFRRQDLDPYLGEEEINKNNELIKTINKLGSKINVAIATCVDISVTRRCEEANMNIYWWNPLYDDINTKNSISRHVNSLNSYPCLATGGNTGTSSWVLGKSILEIDKIGLIGMDFGYAPGTSLNKTQYYKELNELFGDKTDEAYIEINNPYTKEKWMTDPTYYWYREKFLDLVNNTNSNTYNCTEGGILFGKGINFIKLDEFLNL